MAEVDQVSKLLSMCLLVSREAFGKETAAKQTEILTRSSGKPIVFVNNFSCLKDKKKLTERLLNGDDVTMELEFNEIELSDDEKKALAAVKPVLERLRGPVSDYNWTIEASDAEDFLIDRNWRLFGTDTNIGNPAGYRLGKPTCKKVWNFASRFWYDGTTAVVGEIRTSDGYNRATPTVSSREVTIGCQRISRKEVEAVAHYYGFEPNTGEKK